MKTLDQEELILQREKYIFIYDYIIMILDIFLMRIFFETSPFYSRNSNSSLCIHIPWSLI